MSRMNLRVKPGILVASFVLGLGILILAGLLLPAEESWLSERSFSDRAEGPQEPYETASLPSEGIVSRALEPGKRSEGTASNGSDTAAKGEATFVGASSPGGSPEDVDRGLKRSAGVVDKEIRGAASGSATAPKKGPVTQAPKAPRIAGQGRGAKVLLESSASSAEIAERRGTIAGMLEFADSKGIRGYAFNWQEPELIVEVEVRVDGLEFQRLRADQPRAGAGLAALHGFATGPLEQLNDGGQHTVQVFARREDGPLIQLAGSPKSFGGREVPQGRIMRVADGHIVGWAFDADVPDRAIDVEFRIDGQVASRIKADGPAPEGIPREAEARDGRWFDIKIPIHGSGKVLQIFAVDDGGALRRELRGSPLDPKDAISGRLPVGAVAFTNNTQISGWAYDPDDESRSISVELYVDGQFVERQVANQSFAALVHNPQIKNPNHLWIFNVPLALRDGREHRLSVLAIDDESEAKPELSNSPAVFRPQADSLPSGYVDHVSADVIAGWAYDADSGAEPIEVELWVDGQVQGRVLANRARQDLVPVVAPEASHGYSFPAPALIGDGAFHVVRVFAVNSPTGLLQELARSPMELNAHEPWIGVDIASIGPEGLRISGVEAGSPAAEVGLRVGDFIANYGDATGALDVEVFLHWAYSRGIGERVALTIDRPLAAAAPVPRPGDADAEIRNFSESVQRLGSAAPVSHRYGEWELSLSVRDAQVVESWTRYERSRVEVTVLGKAR